MRVTFKELYTELNETPIAGYGDWNPSKNRIFVKSIRALNADWESYDSLKVRDISVDIYKHKTEDIYIVGSMGDDGFDIVFHIEFMRRDDISKAFGYKNVYNVDGVYTKDSIQGNGYAKAFYRYFVNKGNTILGDEIQYFKARLLWASLSKMDDVVVDVIDIHGEKVLGTDIVLHHGEADYEFDETLYDYSDIKKNIRLVLTKVL
jgi:hypothetical protein